MTKPTPSHASLAGLSWHPHHATSEAAALDMTNARQIAFRTRIRNHYWLTGCVPFTDTLVNITRKKMMMIDKRDKLTDAEVTEVLSGHYGFTQTPEGWTIPELLDAKGVATEASAKRSERARLGGIAKAAKASQGQPKGEDF